jgi:hypothetical protein
MDMVTNILIKNVNGSTLTFQIDINTEKIIDLLNKYSKKIGMESEEL